MWEEFCPSSTVTLTVDAFVFNWKVTKTIIDNRLYQTIKAKNAKTLVTWMSSTCILIEYRCCCFNNSLFVSLIQSLAQHSLAAYGQSFLKESSVQPFSSHVISMKSSSQPSLVNAWRKSLLLHYLLVCRCKCFDLFCHWSDWLWSGIWCLVGDTVCSLRIHIQNEAHSNIYWVTTQGTFFGSKGAGV